MLILASASPRRRELLARVGLVFTVDPADADERVLHGESPARYVARVASEKAELVAARRPGAAVLAADTAVVLGDDVLGKAADEAEARAMLGRLAGRTHVVMTGVCLLAAGRRHELVAHTEVDVRALAPAELAGYLASGEWKGKAGAYAVQGIGAALVRAVRGSYTNVVGLPLAETLDLLATAGVATADLAAGTPS